MTHDGCNNCKYYTVCDSSDTTMENGCWMWEPTSLPRLQYTRVPYRDMRTGGTTANDVNVRFVDVKKTELGNVVK